MIFKFGLLAAALAEFAVPTWAQITTGDPPMPGEPWVTCDGGKTISSGLCPPKSVTGITVSPPDWSSCTNGCGAGSSVPKTNLDAAWEVCWRHRRNALIPNNLDGITVEQGKVVTDRTSWFPGWENCVQVAKIKIDRVNDGRARRWADEEAANQREAAEAETIIQRGLSDPDGKPK